MNPKTSERQRAWQIIAEARDSFLVAEPNVCEICGITSADLRKRHKKSWTDTLHAHHWNGYGHPLDIWWICPSCHKRIRDKGIEHDGKHTLEEVRQLLEVNQPPVPDISLSKRSSGDRIAELIDRLKLC